MSGFDEEILELGDGALFESEAKRRDGEADDVVPPAGDRDSGGARVQQHCEIVAKL